MRYINLTNKTPQGTEVTDPYSKFIKDFNVFITGTIDDEMALEVITTIQFLHLQDKNKKITIYINSHGGSISSGLAIYDYVRHISNPIATIGIGMCASMGAFLLATLSDHDRGLYPNCDVLLHQPLINGGVGGQASDIKIVAENIIRIKEKMNRILADACHVSFEQMSIDCDRDHWFEASEALDYGLVDYIVKEGDEDE